MDLNRNQEAREKLEKIFPPRPITLSEISKQTGLTISDLSNFMNGFNFGPKRLDRLEDFLNKKQ